MNWLAGMLFSLKFLTKCFRVLRFVINNVLSSRIHDALTRNFNPYTKVLLEFSLSDMFVNKVAYVLCKMYVRKGWRQTLRRETWCYIQNICNWWYPLDRGVNTHVMYNIYSAVCDTGYYGPNCSLSCRYPSYGADCQVECKCVQDLCNHISGCDYGKMDDKNTAIYTVSKVLGMRNIALSST